MSQASSFAVSPVFGKAQWVVPIQERDHGVQEAEADWPKCLGCVCRWSGNPLGGSCGTAVSQPN